MKQFVRILSKPSEVDQFCSDLLSTDLKRPIQISFGYVATARTKDQNKLYWMSINDIASATKADPNDVHEFYLDEFCPEKLSEFNGVTKILKSTTFLDTEEMTTYWNLVIAHAATELNPPVFVRHPDDQGRE